VVEESNQCYVLEEDVWSAVTLTGIPDVNYDASKTWHNGKAWYLSLGTKHYKQQSNSKWSAVSFKNIDFQGDCVWTAGENIYCTVKPDDSAAVTYLYDVASQSWVEHNWIGKLKPEDGSKIWTDGINIYYSNNNNHYKLNKK